MATLTTAINKRARKTPQQQAKRFIAIRLVVLVNHFFGVFCLSGPDFFLLLCRLPTKSTPLPIAHQSTSIKPTTIMDGQDASGSNIPHLPPPPSSGGSTAQQNAASKRLQQTQAQVNEVVGIMKVNVEKVLERDQKLSELDARADALQSGASQFEQQAGKLKRKHWWANMKMMMIMGLIGVILLIVIIVSAWPTGSDSVAAPPVVTQAPVTEAAVAAVTNAPGA